MKAAFLYTWGDRETRYHPIFPAKVAAVDVDTSLMQYAGLDTVIASYWPDTDLAAILSRSRLPVAPLFESEAYNPPGDAETKAAIDKLYALFRLASRRWARQDGKPVLFVYNHWPVADSVRGRWVRANAGRFYLVMRSGPNEQRTDPGVDRWYCYEPTGRGSRVPGAVSISPGFWKYDEPVVLPRDLDAWKYAVRLATAAREYLGDWLLVTTWNEWPEGTGIAPTYEWGAEYMEVLRE